MLRPFLALLMGKSKSEQPAQASAADRPIGVALSEGNPAVPDRERLPPRDDSFYLGICFSHW